jgi:hypothetical protein
MRSTRPLFFTLIRKARILPLGARLRSRTGTAVTSLHAQTCRKDKLTNSGTEATEEGIEGLLWGGVVSHWSIDSQSQVSRRIDKTREKRPSRVTKI